MGGFFQWISDTTPFPARWSCGRWDATLGWLHIGADLATFAAYLAIPAVMGYFLLRRRRELSYPGVMLLFATFLVACGLGHLVETIIFWTPVYRFAAVLKLLTALLSWATVIALVRITPQAFALPGYARLSDSLEQEIEQRRRGEAERDRFFALSSDLFCVGGFDGRLRRVNPAAQKMFGYSEAELLGTSFLDWVHPDDLAAAQIELAHQTQGLGTDQFEVRLRHHDGSYRWCTFTATPIIEEGLFYAVGRDMTERRRAEAIVRDREAWMRAVLETAADAIVSTDGAGLVMSLNPAAEKMFGYRAEEVLGRNVSMLMPTPYRDEHDQYIARFPRTGEARVIGVGREVTAVRKDGVSFPIELAISQFMQGDRVMFTGFVRDISERKQAEAGLRDYYQQLEEARLLQEEQAVELQLKTRELEAAQRRAEQANQAKSEFLANMSHEIRTPMTAILGFAEVLMSNLTETEDLEAARTIRRNGDYLLSILNDILDLSKIEARKLEVERVACDPYQIIGDVMTLMKVRADEKCLALRVEYDGPLPDRVRTDPTRLRQVLINLVGNAIKFTSQGSVRLVARQVTRFDADFGEEPQLVFEIHDTGIGLTAAQIGKLFRPFSQADSSTTRKHGGTGLGLTISKRLAEYLGGTITVASEPGQGSTFTLCIAIDPLAGVILRRPSDSPFAGGPLRLKTLPHASLNACRVLLAEDGLDNQRLISLILSKAGAHVMLADNGQAAVEAALAAEQAGAPFDVVLMDMQMPVLDGYGAAARLRAEGFARPIIALTAHAMSGDREKCLDAGCDDYTTKPIHRDKLLQLLADYLPQLVAGG